MEGAIKLRGWAEPGLRTRQQQREVAKLNVNHPANLPRVEKAKQANEFVIMDDPFNQPLNMDALRYAMKLMDPWMFVPRPMRPGDLMPMHGGRMRAHGPDFQQLPRDIFRQPAEVRAMRHAADVAREGAMMAAHPPRVTDEALANAVTMASKIGKLTQGLREVYATVQTYSGVWACNANGQPHANAIKEFMSDHGWKHVGSGHFSLAFVKDALCIKVGLKSEDSGAAYAAFARDNAGLKGLPLIHDLQRHGKDSYTVVMPKYVPLNDSEKTRLNWNGREAVLDGWGVGEAYQRILSFFRGMAEIDLHGENVMKTEGGDYIITDPVSFIAGKKPVW